MCVGEGVVFDEKATAIYWYERCHPNGLVIYAQLIGYERDVTAAIAKDGHFEIAWLEGPANTTPLGEPR
jgi:hypothetical protein